MPQLLAVVRPRERIGERLRDVADVSLHDQQRLPADGVREVAALIRAPAVRERDQLAVDVVAASGRSTCGIRVVA